MDEEYHLLPISFNGKDLEFPMQIVPSGYTYKFVITIDEAKVIFEKDDEGQYRAMLAEPEIYKGKMPELGLLRAIDEVLQTLT